jgi:site-specific DNA recombinase
MKHQAQYWTKSMIARILDNPIYCGRLVTNKYYNDFKLKKKVANRKGNYQYISGTHQPIIAPKIFDKVQEMKKGTTKENQKEYVFLLRDLVYCKNCGRKMLYKNSNPMRIDKYGKVTGTKNELGYFICAEHYRHQDICNEWIKIKENTLNEIVLKQVSNKLKKLQLYKYANDVKAYKEIMNPEASECKKIKNEITRREADFKILYSKKVEEIISEDEFVREYNLYKQRVTELKEKLDRSEEGKKSYNSKNDVEKLIIEFSEAKKFDNKILKKLVEKIEIGKDEEVNIILKV